MQKIVKPQTTQHNYKHHAIATNHHGHAAKERGVVLGMTIQKQRPHTIRFQVDIQLYTF